MRLEVEVRRSSFSLGGIGQNPRSDWPSGSSELPSVKTAISRNEILCVSTLHLVDLLACIWLSSIAWNHSIYHPRFFPKAPITIHPRIIPEHPTGDSHAVIGQSGLFTSRVTFEGTNE